MTLDPKLTKVLQQVERLLEEDRQNEVYQGCMVEVQRDRGAIYVFDEAGRPIITIKGVRSVSLQEGQLDISIDVGPYERSENVKQCRVDCPILS